MDSKLASAVSAPFSAFERENPSAAKEIYRRLPREMLVTNSLDHGVHAEAKTTGVRRRYIQINHPNVTKLMVFDVDNPVGLYDWKRLDAPVPNMMVINPKNSHAHFVYFLDDTNFVCRTENGKLQSILLYESIYAQLCTILHADNRFVQKIMKNPFHNGWTTEVLHEDTWTFEDFARYVDVNLKSQPSSMSRPESSRQRESEGRNCTVFERTRFYAYAALRQFNNGASESDAREFHEAVLKYAETVNSGFDEQLGQREIAATVKSIVSWTLLHFGAATENSDTLEKKDIWGDSSRKKSLIARQAAKERNMKAAVQMRLEGKSIEEIMKELKRSRRTVEYYLSEYRKRLLESKETRESLQSMADFLRNGVCVQFVISDIVCYELVVCLLRVLGFVLDSS